MGDVKFHHDTIASAISAEIARVSAKRERLLRAAQSADAVGETRHSLYIMDQAMHFARTARDEGCPVAMLSTLRALKDIGE